MIAKRSHLQRHRQCRFLAISVPQGLVVRAKSAKRMMTPTMQWLLSGGSLHARGQGLVAGKADPGPFRPLPVEEEPGCGFDRVLAQFVPRITWREDILG